MVGGVGDLLSAKSSSRRVADMMMSFSGGPWPPSASFLRSGTTLDSSPAIPSSVSGSPQRKPSNE